MGRRFKGEKTTLIRCFVSVAPVIQENAKRYGMDMADYLKKVFVTDEVD